MGLTGGAGMQTNSLKKIDCGNNESYVRGMVRDGKGYLALTALESKTFKTQAGAIAWLAKRGYKPNGERA